MNPWDSPPPPPGTHRVTGALGSHIYEGPWVSEEQATKSLASATDQYGPGLRIEAREDVQAVLAQRRAKQIAKAKAALDRDGAPSVGASEEELRERQAEPERERPVWYSEERPPYLTVKHALGDYAAHCHGPKLAQISRGPGGPHTPAWLTVGTALTDVGLAANDPRRARLLIWACTADDRRGTHGKDAQDRLSGKEWGLKRDLERILRERGIVAQGKR